MKPTLNEEIGMSQQVIDYVNSLEVKNYENITPTEQDVINACKRQVEDTYSYYGVKNNSHKKAKESEQQRIRKQARNAWICVFVIILLTVILNWKS